MPNLLPPRHIPTLPDASEKPQLYGLLVQPLGENPEAIRMAMTSTEKNLERLSEIAAEARHHD